jgi:hypothetical protein
MNKYRFITGTLFKYSKEQKAFIACFTSYRCKTINSAIKAYERQGDSSQ